MYTHILIPTDGSELAQNGVDHGLSLAKALGSKVTVITVTEPAERIYGRGWAPAEQDIKKINEQNKEADTRLLTTIKATAEDRGIACEAVHEFNSSPASAIVEATERLGCNLVVMSSHGRRGIARVLLGSQTAEVVARSLVPVLVVR